MHDARVKGCCFATVRFRSLGVSIYEGIGFHAPYCSLQPPGFKSLGNVVICRVDSVRNVRNPKQFGAKAAVYTLNFGLQVLPQKVNENSVDVSPGGLLYFVFCFSVLSFN